MNKILGLSLWLVFLGCSSVKLAKVPRSIDEGPLTQGEKEKVKSVLSRLNWKNLGPQKNSKNFELAKEFENNFKVELSDNLKYKMKKGKLQEALPLIEKQIQNEKKPLIRWYLLKEKVKLLIMLGNPASAEKITDEIRTLEKELFNFDLLGLSLRGEARLWLHDYENAKRDFLKIVSVLDKWELPISYTGPPTNLKELVAMSSAQIRAYIGLCVLNVLTDNFKEAKLWGILARDRINNVNLVAHHSLYGMFVKVPYDAIYGEAINTTFLGAAILGSGNEDDLSEKYFDLAKTYFTQLNFPLGISTTLAVKAYVLYKLNRFDESEKVADEMFDFAKESGLPNLIWRVEALRGELHLKRGHKDLALKAFLRAHKAVNAISGVLKSDHSKLRFGLGKEGIIKNILKILKEKRKTNEIVKLLEESRGRSFSDMLADTEIKEVNNHPIGKKIAHINKKLKKLMLNSTLFNFERRNSEKNKNQLFKQKENYLNELKKVNPELLKYFYEKSNLSIKKIQNYLKVDQILVYEIPTFSNENMNYLIISKNKSKLINLGLSQDELKEILFSFTDAIAFNDIKEQNKVASILRSKLQIKKWSAPNSVYFLPSGFSYFIPWGILDLKFPLSILPKANWIFDTKNKDYKNEIVLLGDPEFGGFFKKLPGAKKEINSLSKLYNKKGLLGKEATLRGLKKTIKGGTKVLHLATHGKFNPSDPMKSSIILSDGEKAFHFYAKDIINSKLKARTVILSACETGMGKTLAGDDFLGLSRSFYLSGTRSLLSSLWPVSDKGTLFFMEEFHKALQENSLGDSWLKAIEKTKNQGFPPGVYGAFILGGEL